MGWVKEVWCVTGKGGRAWSGIFCKVHRPYSQRSKRRLLEFKERKNLFYVSSAYMRLNKSLVKAGQRGMKKQAKKKSYSLSHSCMKYARLIQVLVK